MDQSSKGYPPDALLPKQPKYRGRAKAAHRTQFPKYPERVEAAHRAQYPNYPGRVNGAAHRAQAPMAESRAEPSTSQQRRSRLQGRMPPNLEKAIKTVLAVFTIIPSGEPGRLSLTFFFADDLPDP